MIKSLLKFGGMISALGAAFVMGRFSWWQGEVDSIFRLGPRVASAEDVVMPPNCVILGAHATGRLVLLDYQGNGSKVPSEMRLFMDSAGFINSLEYVYTGVSGGFDLKSELNRRYADFEYDSTVPRLTHGIYRVRVEDGTPGFAITAGVHGTENEASIAAGILPAKNKVPRRSKGEGGK